MSKRSPCPSMLAGPGLGLEKKGLARESRHLILPRNERVGAEHLSINPSSVGPTQPRLR